jgi:hypothetical protein
MGRTSATLPSGVRVSDHVSLGVIARTFPLEEVRQVLAQSGRSSERERDLLAHVIPEPRVFNDGEATVTQDTSMGSTKGWTIPLMVRQPGRDRPWTKSCVWSGSTV